MVEKKTGRQKSSVQYQVKELREFVCKAVAEIRELIAGKHGNPAIVRQELSRHVDGITILPDGEGVSYRGKWRLLGIG